MKAYLSQLSPLAWVGLSIPALIIARTVLAIVLPEVVQAVVPQTVRTVMHML